MLKYDTCLLNLACLSLHNFTVLNGHALNNVIMFKSVISDILMCSVKESKNLNFAMTKVNLFGPVEAVKSIFF